MERTISATEFAQVTGVSRERLRTWERRHGFPEPVRHQGGPRRYRERDIGIAVAVREAVNLGVPVAEAISQARSEEPSSKTRREIPLAALVESVPAPLAVISGPEPLCVEYANAQADALGLHARAALLESAPDLAGSDLVLALRAIFAGELDRIECDHPPLNGAGPSARSIAFKLPTEHGAHLMVAVLGVDSSRERAARVQSESDRLEVAELRDQVDKGASQLEIIHALSRRLRDERSAGTIVKAATETLIATFEAEDCGVALYMAGELVIGSSSRGTLGPVMVPTSGHPELAAVARQEGGAWLGDSAAVALGAAEGRSVFAFPVGVSGDAVAVLLLTFAERIKIVSIDLRLLETVATMIGLAILRDSFAETAREAGTP